jgi:hypothetical protein
MKQDFLCANFYLEVLLMIVMKKSYEQSPAILWNLVCDIAEMRKGKVTRRDGESMAIDTEMYGISTRYIFRVARSGTGTAVSVETEGESEDDRRRVDLMFATLENMLGPFNTQSAPVA